MTDIHGAIDEAQSLHESIAPIIKERDELVQKLHTIQIENDLIKGKFSKLLD